MSAFFTMASESVIYETPFSGACSNHNRENTRSFVLNNFLGSFRRLH